MSDLNVQVISFEDFLKEDAKSISDANHHKKNGDTSDDKLKEPAEHKIDKNGIETDANQSKANKNAGDKKADKLNEGLDIEGEQKVGDKKDKLDDEGDDKKSESEKEDGDDSDKKDKKDDAEEEEEGDDD